MSMTIREVRPFREVGMTIREVGMTIHEVSMTIREVRPFAK